MKYVSIDIETTGLDPQRNQIIEFAAVFDDLEDPKPIEELPRFDAIVVNVDQSNLSVDPFCLDLHKDFWSDYYRAYGLVVENPDALIAFSDGKYAVNEKRLGLHFYGKLQMLGYPQHITVAGKNVASFDIPFLNQLSEFKDRIKIRSRVIDPAILFMQPGDLHPPNLWQCLNRIGLEPTQHHQALGDAIDVVKLVRKGLLNGV